MQKLIKLLLFINITVFCFATGEKVDYYYDKLLSHEKVKSIESVTAKDGVIIVKGLFYDRVRIDEVFILEGREEGSNAEIIFLTKDIEEGFLKKNEDIKTVKVETTQNSLIVKGKADIMGGTFNISVEGKFSIKNENLNCILTNAKFGYLKIPAWVVKKFNSKLNPFFSFGELGIKIKASEIIFEKERVIIK